jgi:hypothetical protein
MNTVEQAIRASLTPELLKPEYRGSDRPYAGHCYVASEAYWHLRGRSHGYIPHRIKHEGSTHWYLMRRNTGEVIDLTAEQFETSVPYSEGVGCGFLTSKPSKRAQTVIDRVLLRLLMPTVVQYESQ